MRRKNEKWISFALIIFVVIVIFSILLYTAPTIATQDVFINHENYIGQTFRFQGCFEPHKCTMAEGECNIDNLEACCDCIKNFDKCLIVDLQSVSREKLTTIRETDETKFYVEVVGTVILGSRMRPVVINATDLKILGDCA